MIENFMQTHYKFHANTQDANVITVHKTQILQHCTRHRFYQNTQNRVSPKADGGSCYHLIENGFS